MVKFFIVPSDEYMPLLSCAALTTRTYCPYLNVFFVVKGEGREWEGRRKGGVGTGTQDKQEPHDKFFC